MIKPYYETEHGKLYHGDCSEVMCQLQEQGDVVQMCVTSPPYWGLRDYGVDGQLGLESMFEEYVDKTVEVFGLVNSICAENGTFWLNIGDTYNSPRPGARDKDRWPKQSRNAHRASKSLSLNLKPKDLIGIPWRVAFALQADGWYLRSDIIWFKPNPIPESVTDRPTKTHEYLFLLSKSERYYYDAAAIKEPVSGTAHARGNGLYRKIKEHDNQFGVKQHSQFSAAISGLVDERNKRTVWTVATKPCSEAHFATYPPALITPCILAGSKPGDIVLDPFFGSGVTGEVCEKLDRRWIGIELNKEYCDIAVKRIERERAQMKLFNQAEG